MDDDASPGGQVPPGVADLGLTGRRRVGSNRNVVAACR
jgi:hypothetical protein